MLEIPDIVGFSLGEALKALQKEGVAVDSITVTSAPKRNLQEFDESFRVVRIETSEDEKIRLLVCKPL